MSKMEEEFKRHCIKDGMATDTSGLAWRDFSAGYQAAQSESGWVPIADIPEEWKDGRVLLGINERQHHGVIWWGFDDVFNDYRFDGNIFDERGNCYSACNQKITHAMLPPTPPKKEG